jgi:hypothetical protein
MEDVLTNSTSESTIWHHGYDKETRPQLSIQSEVQIGQDVTFLGLVAEILGLDARLVGLQVWSSLKVLMAQQASRNQL